MKIIMEGGINSKNSPNYTLSSFSISNNNPNIFGIKVDCYLSNDNEIILINKDVLKQIGLDQSYLKNTDYKKLKNINYGNKIKNHTIITLDELLNLNFENKKLILNLMETDKDHILVDKVIEKIAAYKEKEILIMSKSINIVELLYSKNIPNKIGLYLSRIRETRFSLDFYSVDIDDIDLISNNSNIFVLVDNVKNIKDITKIKKFIQNLNNTAIITSNYNLFSNKILDWILFFCFSFKVPLFYILRIIHCNYLRGGIYEK